MLFTKHTPYKRLDKPTTKPSRSVKPKKSADVQVSRQMLYEVRDELKSHFLAIEHRLTSHDKMFQSQDAKFSAEFAKLHAEIHKILLLLEEQNNKNNFVLDGYAQIYDRQLKYEEKFDTEIKEIKKQIAEKF